MLVEAESPSQLREKMRSFDPHICALSCSYTKDVGVTLELASAIKEEKKDALVIVGGHHPSLKPDDFLHPAVDIIVVGEGEITIRELVRALERGKEVERIPGLVLNRHQDGGQIFTGPRERIEDLDLLPFPSIKLTRPYRKYYFLGFEKGVALLETSRGCPFRCNFCSVHKFFGGAVRYKSPKRVVEEILRIPEDKILICDDHFFSNIPRAWEIAHLIREAGIRKKFWIQARSDSIARNPDLVAFWKETGLAGVLVGFEKVTDEGLGKLEKKACVRDNERAIEVLERCKVGYVADFIVDPEDTKEDFQKLLAFVRKWKIRNPIFSILTPLPGTELFQKLQDKITSRRWELFDNLHAVLPTKLPLPEFYREFCNLYSETFRNSVVGSRGIFEALKRLFGRKLGFRELLGFLKASKMIRDPEIFLKDHGLEGI